MPQPLLSGEVEYVNEERVPDQIEMLRAEIVELRDELNGIKSIMLRQYSAYRQAFGEQTVTSSDSTDKWVAVKLRLPPRQREAIDVLLLQGSMKRVQLASALKMNYTNCATNVIAVLIRQGWLIDNGGNLSLKQL